MIFVWASTTHNFFIKCKNVVASYSWVFVYVCVCLPAYIRGLFNAAHFCLLWAQQFDWRVNAGSPCPLSVKPVNLTVHSLSDIPSLLFFQCIRLFSWRQCYEWLLPVLLAVMVKEHVSLLSPLSNCCSFRFILTHHLRPLWNRSLWFDAGSTLISFVFSYVIPEQLQH